MKKIIILFIIPFIICSCSNKEDVVVVQRVNCEQKNKLLTEDAILIDVRTSEEYKEEHLDEAINISVETIASVIEDKVKDKSTKIVVYCRSGKRSSNAANILIDKGYKNVYDLGGINNCLNS